MRPQTHPAESHSFIGMARETAAMPPARIGSYTSIQVVHTHIHTHTSIIYIYIYIHTRTNTHTHTNKHLCHAQLCHTQLCHTSTLLLHGRINVRHWAHVVARLVALGAWPTAVIHVAGMALGDIDATCVAHAALGLWWRASSPWAPVFRVPRATSVLSLL